MEDNSDNNSTKKGQRSKNWTDTEVKNMLQVAIDINVRSLL